MNKTNNRKNNYDMLKEIKEQPTAIGLTIKKEGKKIKDLSHLLDAETVYLVGSGSSYYCGRISSYIYEALTGRKAICSYSIEFLRYNKELVTDKDLVFFLSQSGETLETIKAAKEVKGETISLTNTPRSTLTGLTDFTLLSHAGKEKAIPSTKSFTSMLAVLTLLAIENSKSNLKKNLIEIPSKIAKVLKDLTKPTKIIAKHFIREEMVDLIGDGINYPVTLEGALKLKETARMHAQGMPIGEYAHGHISLVTEGYPLIVVAIGKEKDRATRSFLKKLEELTPYAPIISMEPIEQIGGAPNLLVPRANEILSPFISVPIFQLFAYQTAIAKGLNPDKPRGLRKIVDRF